MMLINWEGSIFYMIRLKEKELNPLRGIQVGTGNEVLHARAFAREVAEKARFRPEWETLVVQCISVAALHLLYAHYADPEHYYRFPCVEDLRNFLQINIVEEEVEDEDGNPIYDEETGEVKKRISAKGFVDTLCSLLEFEHVPYGGIHVDSIRGYHRCIDAEVIHGIYMSDEDIYLVNPHVHPWIYRNMLALCNDPDTDKASAMAAAALELYIDDNPSCRLFLMKEKLMEFASKEIESNQTDNKEDD